MGKEISNRIDIVIENSRINGYLRALRDVQEQVIIHGTPLPDAIQMLLDVKQKEYEELNPTTNTIDAPVTC